MPEAYQSWLPERMIFRIGGLLTASERQDNPQVPDNNCEDISMADQIDVAAASASQTQIRRTLLAECDQIDGAEAAGLAPVRGNEVRVFIVPPGRIAQLSGSIGAGGTVMREDDTYLIFVDKDSGYSDIRQALGNFARRFLVLHEYAHALQGDVMEDAPEAILSRSPADHQFADACANGYAAERLIHELQREHPGAPQIDDLRTSMKANGWISPFDSRYLDQNPELRSEKASWSR